MPLYMDVHHNMVGLTDEAVTAAHQQDLEVQQKYGVKYVSYWYDKDVGKIFCLVEAPSKVVRRVSSPTAVAICAMIALALPYNEAASLSCPVLACH